MGWRTLRPRSFSWERWTRQNENESSIIHGNRIYFPLFPFKKTWIPSTFHGIYRYSSIPSVRLDSGDVYARAKLRSLEIRSSIQFIFEQLDTLPAPKPRGSLGPMAKNALTISLVEGHRGEVAHVVLTDSNGRLAQVKIKDPSFHNWQGLALAVRENGISDFPLCNKSFDLSYAGHDLWTKR